MKRWKPIMTMALVLVCGMAAALPAAATETITITPALYALLTGAYSQAAAHIVPEVSNHTIQFTLSGPGSLSPTSAATDARGRAVTTYTADGGSGMATITAQDLTDPGQPQASCQIAVFSISTTSNPIWWFNGQTPSGSDSWALHYGTTIVSITPTTGAQTTATSTGQSVPPGNDAGVDFTWNNHFVGTTWLTVLTPKAVRQAPVNFAVQNGWESDFQYNLTDQLNSALPASIPVNESWTTAWTQNPPGVPGFNWPQPSATSGWVGPASFTDHLFLYGLGAVPLPQNPQTPLGTTAVVYIGQHWNVGSTSYGVGKVMVSDTLQYWLDHGTAQ